MKRIIFLILAILVISLGFAPAAEAKFVGGNQYPKVANWYFKWDISDKKVDELAKYDMLLIDMETAYYSRDNLVKIKEENPDIILLAYLSPVDIRKDATSFKENNYHKRIGEAIEAHPEWILRQTNGNPAEWWPGNYILDITNQEYRQWMADFVQEEIADDPIWDGIFYDNLWDGIDWLDQDVGFHDEKWRSSMKKLLKRTRNEAKKEQPKFIISGNSGITYYKQLNGSALENFPNTSYGDWTWSMEKYMFIIKNAEYDPKYGLINTNTDGSGKKTNYRKMRYGLASALMANGFSSFDDGDESHTQTWWYDEYNVALGQPLGPAYNTLNVNHPKKVQKGVWRRDYENGIVLLNSTKKKRKVNLETGYEKITGTQDTEVNNGKNVGQVTIPKRDGLVLLGRINQIENAPYINGAYAKVFSSKGRQKRNPFFIYDSNYGGGAQIIKLNKKTIVARNTWVTIYNKKGKELARFAPFGEGFDGQINIDVGYLHKKKSKGKTLVVGSRDSGGMIRQYSLKGDLIHPGCFPYGEGFNGGINLAVGDVVGGKSGEIVVAPRSEGGPHVKVMSRSCYDRTPGFMAYDPNMRDGVSVAVGNVTGDYKEEIVTAPGIGSTPFIQVFNGDGKLLKPGFFAYNEGDRSGVFVSVANIDKTKKEEIITNSFGIFD
ncbi:putative glycoside hydrolase family 15 protein [Patescibacteria group bacterium]|nr:putative glycoside hydrolase family 15 protein [Patescibacteria group bacterium]MBU1673283.1 putative glycoside hydrolase family 15 protein [Patescibacteria group bacterium]MBU1963336.1 putative glycoside hydrolase family 15 protein [Patescibacteria group bacterium]